MLDGWARRRIDPALNATARAIAATGLSANAVTVLACLVGLVAMAAIALHAYWAGLVLILLSRFLDGLDGALAKIRGPSDFGGYLDIVLDFVFYGAIPLGFVLADPQANGLAGAALIFAFYINGASFLAYAVLAERHKLSTDVRGAKALYFTTGLAEATETIAVFVLACLLPQWFAVIAWVFAAICVYTTLARIVLAGRTFG